MNVPRRVRRHVIADRVQIAAQPALEELAGSLRIDHGKIDAFLRNNLGIANAFCIDTIISVLLKKAEWISRDDFHFLHGITATSRECRLARLYGVLFGGNSRRIETRETECVFVGWRDMQRKGRKEPLFIFNEKRYRER